MESFGAQPASAEPVSKGNVADGDLFIGIYAFRYGYTPEEGGPSVTEMEFDEARSLGKRCLCHVANETLRPAQSDESPEKLERLTQFKARVDRELVRATFDRYEDLPSLIQRDLYSLIRPITAASSDRSRWLACDILLVRVARPPRLGCPGDEGERLDEARTPRAAAQTPPPARRAPAFPPPTWPTRSRRRRPPRVPGDRAGA
jgi:hypothetical protein